jgi:hypothetical protein
MAGAVEEKVIPHKGHHFRIKEFSDMVWEFVVEKHQARALKQRSLSGEYVFPRNQ